MGTDYTKQSVSGGFDTTATINQNFTDIETALGRTLNVYGDSTTGTNALQVDLDANSQKIINMSDGVNNSDAVTYRQLIAQIAASGSGLIASQRESQLGSAATANKFTLAGITYTPGANNLYVFRNGQKLINVTDYTETSGTEVTLTFSPNSNDTFEFITNSSTTSSVQDASGVTYTPSGTGAIATDVQSKLRQYAHTLEDFYGYPVADSSDITTALQALIDDTTNVKQIQLPAGSFVISSTITIDRDITIRGMGGPAGGTYAERTVPGGATGNPGESSTRLTFTGTSGAAFALIGTGTEGLENVHLSDFIVTGNATCAGGLAIGSGGTVYKSSFKNLLFEDFTNTDTDTGYGILIELTQQLLFENVYCHGNRDGINIKGNTTTLRTMNVHSRVNTRYGLLIQQMSGSHIQDITLEGNGDSALKILPKAGANVSENVFGPGVYTEANLNTATGYSIDIGAGSGAGTVRDNKFYAVDIQDTQGAISGGGTLSGYINMDRADAVIFHDTVLPAVTSGFAKVTSNTTNCAIYTRGGYGVEPSNIDGQGYASGQPYCILGDEVVGSGSWTPTADANITFSGAAGQYIRNGNWIKCWGNVNVTDIAATTGVTIGGLPFTPKLRCVSGAGSTVSTSICRFIDIQTDKTVDITWSATYSGGAVTFYFSFDYYL